MLKTSVIGSYALPPWLITATNAMERGEYGPKDIEETLNDAVNMAISDQEEAGLDVVSDGEMRRFGFFTAGFYGYLSGLSVLEPLRRLGSGGTINVNVTSLWSPLLPLMGSDSYLNFFMPASALHDH